MSLSPLAYVDSLRVGMVDFVSPDEIRVQLSVEAPDQMALNTGEPRAFPRVNGYVLIPCNEGYLVSQVTWITIERSQYPKRQGLKDFGLVDLPYPLRKMSLSPMGVLSLYETEDGIDKYTFCRGVIEYPTVGDPVLLPTRAQLRAIVESGDNRYVLIGHSPLAANAEVRIDPDRLFGRHLAVLGNTGSGKSCSVAGLIRWSLEEARRQNNDLNSCPNARFIILDPNGEYSNSFTDMGEIRVFSSRIEDMQKHLEVPFWLWNSEEWSTFAKASGRTQKPVLIQALRSVRDGLMEEINTPKSDMRRFLRTILRVVQNENISGRPWGEFPGPKNFYAKIKKWQSGLCDDSSYSENQSFALSSLREYVNALVDDPDRNQRYPQYEFGRDEIARLLYLLKKTYHEFGGSDQDVLPLDADIPRPFTGDQLLRSVEINSEIMSVSDYTETMLMRIRSLFADTRLRVISGDEIDISLEEWLTDYVGDNEAANGAICVIDLSLVPSEVVNIVTAVIARMVFESLQRYRKVNSGKVLPTVLTMEEAHTFIKRYSQDSEDRSASQLCTEIFEKIAREGRKFGLGLVLSSQRPSELSPTVLSQCNSFLLHRISNDRDQELVRHLVPDNMHGLMRDLPVLPAKQAILMGWASELPVLVEMNELPKTQRPQSSDPDFWDVWTGRKDRSVDWKAIADDWQQNKLVSTRGNDE